MTSYRVPGHELRSRGLPYVGDGVAEVEGDLRRNRYDSLGVALCACGWRSEVLDSTRQRQQAHRAHKAEIHGNLVVTRP